MSNWDYANVVPTTTWRSAMTVPRELGLEKAGERYLLTSKPVKELDGLAGERVSLQNIDASDYDLTEKTGNNNNPSRISLASDNIQDFSIIFSNDKGQKVVVGFDSDSNQYFMDRTASGSVDFKKGFAARHTSPRLTANNNMNLTLVIDHASIELFADNGLTAMTQVFFPDGLLSNIRLQSKKGFLIKSLEFTPLKSIYQPASMAVK
jgi:fructan beta-fructosidase